MSRQNELSKTINNKLRSNSGESLAETLIALLISALALALLAGVISTSGHIITTTRNTLDRYYTENEKLAKLDGNKTVVVSFTESDDSTETIASEEVIYYKNDTFSNNPVVAFRLYEGE